MDYIIDVLNGMEVSPYYEQVHTRGSNRCMLISNIQSNIMNNASTTYVMSYNTPVHSINIYYSLHPKM